LAADLPGREKAKGGRPMLLERALWPERARLGVASRLGAFLLHPAVRFVDVCPSHQRTQKALRRTPDPSGSRGLAGGGAFTFTAIACPSAFSSVGAALKVPCRFERILNCAAIALREVSDDHHVLDVPGWDAEGPGKLPHYRVAIIEIGPDHQMRVVLLSGHQPAVVPPLRQALRRSAAHTRQGLGQARYVVDIHGRCLPERDLG